MKDKEVLETDKQRKFDIEAIRKRALAWKQAEDDYYEENVEAATDDDDEPYRSRQQEEEEMYRLMEKKRTHTLTKDE